MNIKARGLMLLALGVGVLCLAVFAFGIVFVLGLTSAGKLSPQSSPTSAMVRRP